VRTAKPSALTQVHLADLLGTSQQTLTAYDNGTRLCRSLRCRCSRKRSAPALMGDDATRHAQRQARPGTEDSAATRTR